MMRKILIADDNRLALQSARETIPWQEWGYELTAMAENGTEAWEKIQEYRPDIVILDIHMPGLSGLEVAGLIQQMEKKPVVILLSAYDKFTYAKTGIRLGVFDYLLKPLDTAELRAILDKASQKLDREEAQAPQQENARWKKEWQEKLLIESTGGVEPSAKILEDSLKEQWNAYCYAVLLVHELESETDPEEQIQSVVEDVLEQQKIRYLLARTKEGSLILAGFQTLRFAKDYDWKALKIANQIADSCRKSGYQVVAGISNHFERLSELEKRYEEARFAIESRFFLEQKTVIHYQSVMSKSVHNEYVLSRKMQELYQTMKQSPEQFQECLEDFITLMQKDDRYEINYVKQIFVQIAFSISCMLNEQNIGDRQIKTMDAILEETRCISSMQDMAAWIRNYARESIDMPQQEMAHTSVQTRRVLDYLNLHYMEHITLGDAADEAGISESHLCRLLKQETGETFVNILNKIRIQKAVQLIQSGHFKNYEVAEKVGFSNYAYFFQVFKKITGKTPMEIRGIS